MTIQTNILLSGIDHKSPCAQCAIGSGGKRDIWRGSGWFIISLTSWSIFGNHFFSCNNFFLVFTRPWWLSCAMDMALWWSESGVTMWWPRRMTSASWLTVNMSLQITTTLLDRLLQVHSQEMFPTGLCWSSPQDVCFFIFGCLFNLLIRHGFVYSTGDEEVVAILCHFLMCLNFILIGMSREKIRGIWSYCVCITEKSYPWSCIFHHSIFAGCFDFTLSKIQLNWTAICKKGEVSTVQVYV